MQTAVTTGLTEGYFTTLQVLSSTGVMTDILTLIAGGGGGGGGASRSDGNGWDAELGGSGVVILRYPSDFTCTVGAGLTQSSNSPLTQGTKKVTVLTAGSGTVTFS